MRVICANCGKEVALDDKFCKECGQKMDEANKIIESIDKVEHVMVTLKGGLKRSLYMLNGKFYLDSRCVREYPLSHLIEGDIKRVHEKPYEAYGPRAFLLFGNSNIFKK